MKKNVYFFVALVPFFLFTAGYLAARFFLQKSYVYVPNLLGASLREGAMLLGQRGLFLSVLREQEDPHAKDGTITQQLPVAGQQSRFQQPVYVTIAKQSELKKAPSLFGLTAEDVVEVGKKAGLIVDIVSLPVSYSNGVCFAQTPEPGELLTDGRVTVFIAAPNRQIVMIPDFIGLVYEEISDQLQKQGFSHEIFNVRDEGELLLPEHRIIDQRPYPGALVEKSKEIHIQFQVE